VGFSPPHPPHGHVVQVPPGPGTAAVVTDAHLQQLTQVLVGVVRVVRMGGCVVVS